MSCKLRIPMAHNLLVYLSAPVLIDFSAFAEGSINFDIKVISGDPNIVKLIASIRVHPEM